MSLLGVKWGLVTHTDDFVSWPQTDGCTQSSQQMDTHTTQRFVLTTLAIHNSQQMDVYMLTTDTVTQLNNWCSQHMTATQSSTDVYMLTTYRYIHTMLTTDTQPRTQLHDVSWAVFDFAWWYV